MISSRDEAWSQEMGCVFGREVSSSSKSVSESKRRESRESKQVEEVSGATGKVERSAVEVSDGGGTEERRGDGEHGQSRSHRGGGERL